MRYTIIADGVGWVVLRHPNICGQAELLTNATGVWKAGTINQAVHHATAQDAARTLADVLPNLIPYEETL